MSKFIDVDEFFRTFAELNVEPYNRFPTADVKPIIKGEWILNDDQVYECKDCGYVPSFDGYTYYNYCPDCGAEMKEVEDER